MYSFLGHSGKREEGCFSERGLAEKSAWRDIKDQLVLIRDQNSLPFCEIRNNFTPALLFIRQDYK